MACPSEQVGVDAMEKKLLGIKAAGLTADYLAGMGAERTKGIAVPQDSLFGVQ